MPLKPYTPKPPAFSIPIILGLVSLMILLMVVLYSQAYESLKYSSNTKNSTIAYYYAAAALQEAQLETGKQASGYEEIDKKLIIAGKEVGSWTVYGRSGKMDNGEYIIPYPGSGNAADNCSILKPNKADLNDKCNWEKIAIGDQVSVPVYLNATGNACFGGNPDDNGDGICNPAEIDLTTLKIKIRTPNGEVFYVDLSNPDTDSTIVHWEITGENSNNPGTNQYTLQAITTTNPNGFRHPLNSEINEGKINNQSTTGFIILDDGKTGKDLNTYKGNLINFLKNIAQFDPISDPATDNNNWANANRKIYKPILKLSIIHSLCGGTVTDMCGENGSLSIPYLEYQIVTNVPIAGTKRIFLSTGTAQNFTQRIRKDVPQEGSSILNFVISD